MEEKMRRQKEKEKSETTDTDDIQSTSEHTDNDDDDDNDNKNSTDDEILSSTVLNLPQEPIIDDDGQSHNIDNAVQYENEPPPPHRNNENENQDYNENYGSSSTLTNVPTSKYISTTTNAANTLDVQHRQRTSNSGRDKIEFEKIEVVEIKSDGTTGHLFPRQYHK